MLPIINFSRNQEMLQQTDLVLAEHQSESILLTRSEACSQIGHCVQTMSCEKKKRDGSKLNQAARMLNSNF